jgi:uncharacterized protein
MARSPILEEQLKLSVTPIFKAILPRRTGFALRTALAAGAALCLGASSAGSQTSGQQLPPGFHSFVPQAQDQAFVRVLSEQARADRDRGIAAYMAKDYEAAINLLGLPAEQGDAQSNWMIAHMYRKGLGGTVNKAAAFEIYERMAANYDGEEPDANIRFFMVDGLTKLADALRTGNSEAGVKRDRRRALRYYNMAASAGSADAQYGLGSMYVLGDGVAKDESYGIRWLGAAAKKRHSGASALLGDVYSEAGDKVRAVMWYRVAADTAGAALSAKVLEKHERLSQQLDQKQLGKVDSLYSNWVRRYPAQQRTAN